MRKKFGRDRCSLKVYLLKPKFTASGDTVYRSVGVVPADRSALISWHGLHSSGRKACQSGFGVIRFEWRDPSRKKIADFPSAGHPGGIYSAKAVSSLRWLLETNGDIHPLGFEKDTATYFLFDCWAEREAATNLEFNPFQSGSLNSIRVGADVTLTDAFIVPQIPGLMVSERFKEAAEAAGLTGMDFTEIEVITD